MQLAIRGGARLSGTVPIAGAKNAVLPGCAAALLTDELVIIRRVPRLRDVTTIIAVISELGKDVEYHGDTLVIRAGAPLRTRAARRYVERMRASFLVLGPLLARRGRAEVPMPGGCTIGPRPVDYHLHGLAALGARVVTMADRVVLTANGLHGARFRLPYPSVGATEQLLMAATLAHGETVIENPAREPEVFDLIALLTQMGAEIETDPGEFRIQGQAELGGADHTVIPDRLEAGTYLIAGAVTAGRVTVTDVRPDDLTAVVAALTDSGVHVAVADDAITVEGGERPRPLALTTAPHPGFPTDLQPPFVALLTHADGTSTVRDTVFPTRFGYVAELNRMGAMISASGGTARITGVDRLTGADLTAPDIRAGAALIIAALAARGTSTIHGVDQIDRGYMEIERKLQALGAEIDRRD